ncbi:hypothetical protein KIN20_004784 [Parelaphostrongylus tenuis]|uniref:Uncharacterized protein n=1 Tax=Parelaphostrongylus tenuis TaxID=148309 RepID=A0AAD5LZ22_PARTN|nr:hypothetical protein KIN20_004784 [Parelaphostrongylus tenuis]
MGNFLVPERAGARFLTKRKGVDQAHKLGLSLRRRYLKNGFLDSRYLPSEVCVPRIRCPFVVNEMKEIVGAVDQLTDVNEVGLAVPQWFNEEAKREADYLLDVVIFNETFFYKRLEKRLSL